MRRKGFTLTELMVVIGIVALLLAILAPSVAPVLAMGRATICRNNLHHLGNAFVASANLRFLPGSRDSNMQAATRIYPEGMRWPGIPSDATPDLAMYRCPDDVTKASLKESLAKLTYVCPYGAYPMDTTDGLASYYRARRNSDSTGSFTEYLLEDDTGSATSGQLSQLNFNGWWDTDGYVRMYDDGRMWVPRSIPPEMQPLYPGANGAFPNSLNTCGDINGIYWEGAPAFGDGLTRNNIGWHTIPGWSAGNTNYGISNYAKNYSYGRNIIVLADSKELIVNLDDALAAETMLIKAARHLGRNNYLMGDGSVKTAYPMDISPRVHPEKWKP